MSHLSAGLLGKRTFRNLRLSGLAGYMGMSAAITLLTTGCADKNDSGSGGDGLAPVLTVEFTGTGADLATSENLLVLSARNNGLLVYDTTVPERPLDLAALHLPHVYRAVVQGPAVYGFDEQLGLSFADLRNASSLQLTQSLSVTELYGYVSDAVWDGQSLLFATGANGLSQFTVSPSFSLAGGRVHQDRTGGPAGVVSLVGNRLVTASFRGEVNTYDWRTSDDGARKLVASATLVLDQPVTDVACNVSHCYAAAMDEGVVVFTPGPEPVSRVSGSLALPDTVDQIFVDGGLLYVSWLRPGGRGGWYVLDLTDPVAPSLVTRVALGSEVRDFAVAGSYIYVLEADGRLHIYARDALP